MHVRGLQKTTFFELRAGEAAVEVFLYEEQSLLITFLDQRWFRGRALHVLAIDIKVDQVEDLYYIKSAESSREITTLLT